MALLTPATDIQTKQIIWISTNIEKGLKQSNSHTNENLSSDGLTAADWSGLYSHRYSH